ncbi:gamma-glutamylcyclotransferase [Halobacteriovorax sp.]|uniref:gamma-glutamylcyclotransferase n=1 Tax=Halobacteriovorax sp. TaxID=2020862 RepID=UPI003564F9D0
MKIFIFGSLLSQEVLNTVIGEKYRDLNKIPLFTISNYQAMYVQDEDYPMLIKQTGSTTQGKIISIESNKHLERLAYYEGNENPLTLITGQEDSLYAFIADSSLPASTTHWSYEDWYKSTIHTAFISRVKSFMSYFDKGIEAPW